MKCAEKQCNNEAAAPGNYCADHGPRDVTPGMTAEPAAKSWFVKISKVILEGDGKSRLPGLKSPFGAIEQLKRSSDVRIPSLRDEAPGSGVGGAGGGVGRE
jgi:hypothetical protein